MKAPSSIRSLPTAALLGLALPHGAHAELLVYEPFDYPVGANILGQNGGGGFTGAWRGHEGDATNVPAGSFTVASGSLAHPTATLATTGNSAIASGEFGTLQPARDFNNIVVGEGDTLWISYIGQRQGTALVPPHEYGDNDYPRGVNVGVFNSEHPTREERVGIGNSSNAALNEWSIIPEGSSSLRLGGGTPFNELAWAVLRIDFVGDDTVADDYYLWLNPDPAVEPTLETANVTILSDDTNSVDASDLDYLRPFIGNESSNRPFGVLAFDEFRIGTTYADMSATEVSLPSDLRVTAVERSAGQFQVTVAGLDTAATYDLVRGPGPDDTTEVVDTIVNPAATDTFTDSAPPEDEAFYRVQDQ